LIIKYKALAKRIESGNDLLSTVSPNKAQTPGVESIKKFNNERRRFSNPNSKGSGNYYSASKSPLIGKIRADSKDWNYSTLLSSKNEYSEKITNRTVNSLILLK
jgi:hypothetical protein